MATKALKIARANVKLLPASYNLAGIYAQNGQREKALALLKRHFFQYERYQAVRAKEMMEARVDAVFDSLREDAGFVALTRSADGKTSYADERCKGHAESREVADCGIYIRPQDQSQLMPLPCAVEFHACC